MGRTTRTRRVVGRRARRGALPGALAIVTAAGLGAPSPSSAQVADTTTAPDRALDVDTAAVHPDSLGPAYDAPLPAASETHLDHITGAYAQAPGGMGLIPAGMAEAGIAAEHVRLARRDSTDLSNMTRHMAHVLHAIDPNEVGQGPGMGYGFKQAAQGVLTHVRLATAEEELPGVLAAHAPYVERAARGALATADDAIRIARRVQQASSASEARRLVRELDYLVRAMAYGDDRDDDGRIGFTETESGLAQATYHLTLVRRVTDPLLRSPGP